MQCSTTSHVATVLKQQIDSVTKRGMPSFVCVCVLRVNVSGCFVACSFVASISAVGKINCRQLFQPAEGTVTGEKCVES